MTLGIWPFKPVLDKCNSANEGSILTAYTQLTHVVLRSMSPRLSVTLLIKKLNAALDEKFMLMIGTIANIYNTLQFFYYDGNTSGIPHVFM